MSIRMVAVDLDGTLLNSHSTISPANRQALSELVRRRVHIVVVTGRRYPSAQKVLGDLGLPMTLITSNGAMVRSESGEILRRSFLPCDTAVQVLAATPEYRKYAVVIFDLAGRGQVTMEHGAVPEGPLGWYLTHSPDHLLQIPDLTACLMTDPIQLMFGGPPECVGPIEPLLRAAFEPSQFHLTWTKYLGRNLSILDVMNSGCTKGAAVALWAERMGIPAGDVMALGDNFNDLEMLEFAGRPVVMANSTPGLARNGWAKTLSNDEDGVARAIEDYVTSLAASGSGASFNLWRE
jgi:hydroxymethylpyrimidine pyrophosphatase-like HAD family hydrolase